MIKPSYFGLATTGVLIFIALILLFLELQKNNNALSGVILINLILFLSTVIGIHSILHFMAEISYNYNPMETGKWYY